MSVFFLVFCFFVFWFWGLPLVIGLFFLFFWFWGLPLVYFFLFFLVLLYMDHSCKILFFVAVLSRLLIYSPIQSLASNAAAASTYDTYDMHTVWEQDTWLHLTVAILKKKISTHQCHAIPFCNHTSSHVCLPLMHKY